ncbi:MAG: TonB-dependent receptor [Neisseria sp.]|nr:TonB-dependent receptor [Neisseria sp.]
MLPRPFRPCLLLSLLAGVPVFAAAPANGGTAAAGYLDDVTVQGKSRSTRTENRDSFTTSAMRTTTGLALPPQETPQSVSVITNTQLEGQGITRLEDAMKTTTGVLVLRDSDRSRFQSRGFYIDQIEEDGISSDVSSHVGETIHNAESQTDLAVYDHIEVVRGATGLTQANGEPGGTINAVRKRPTAERHFNGSLSAGRFGSRRAEADVSGRLNGGGTLRGRLVGAWEKSDSFTDRISSRQGMVYGVLDADLGENTVWTLGGLYQKHHTVPDVYGLPAGSMANPLILPRNAYSGADWNNSRFGKRNIFTEVRHYFNDDWKITGIADYRRDHAFREYSALSSTPSWQNSSGTIWSSGSRRADNKTKQWTVQANLTGKFDAFGRRHDVFATYSSNSRHTDSDTMQHWDLRLDPDSWNNRWCASQGWPHWCDPDLTHDFPLHPFDGSLIPHRDWGELAELDYRFNPIHRHMVEKTRSRALSAGIRFNAAERLHILGGIRYTRWRYTQNTTDILNPGRPVELESLARGTSRNRAVPYLGLTWDITPRSSLYGSYTSIFKPQPGYNDAAGGSLPPLTGTNLELGWKGAWRGNRLNTAVALFRTDQRNRAVYAGEDDDGRGFYANTGHVVSRGLDAEISGHLTDNWQLFAGYTYNAGKYRNNEDGNLSGDTFSQHTPRHILRLYTQYRLPVSGGKWRVGAGMSAQSRTGDMYGQPHLRQGGYTLWHADLQFSPDKHTKISLIGNNLSDKRYFENNANRNNGGYNFYGMPRNLVVRFSWRI